MKKDIFDKFFNFCESEKEKFCDLNFLIDLMLSNHNSKKYDSYFSTVKPKKKECLTKKEYKMIGDFLMKIGIFTNYCKYNNKLDNYTLNQLYYNRTNKEVIEIIKEKL